MHGYTHSKQPIFCSRNCTAMTKPKSPPTAAVFLLFSTAFLHSFTAPTEALQRAIPRNQLRRRPTGPPGGGGSKIPVPPPEPPFVPNYNWVQQEFVEAHNALRAKVGSPPLAWDSTLTKYAHDYAVRRKKDCDYRIHSGGPYGENLFWQKYRESGPRDVVKSWFEEQQFFDHKTNRCKCQPQREGCECGHYTNVVWKSSQKIGCSGYVYCDAQKGILIVCSYHPKGNIIGLKPLSR